MTDADVGVTGALTDHREVGQPHNHYASTVIHCTVVLEYYSINISVVEYNCTVLLAILSTMTIQAYQVITQS